jgi:hypothetical protein
LVAATPLNVTAAAPVKLAPVIVTTVPPVAGPALGETEATVGGAGVHETSTVKLPKSPVVLARRIWTKAASVDEVKVMLLV